MVATGEKITAKTVGTVADVVIPWVKMVNHPVRPTDLVAEKKLDESGL
jgi:hypothetical protein